MLDLALSFHDLLMRFLSNLLSVSQSDISQDSKTLVFVFSVGLTIFVVLKTFNFIFGLLRFRL